MATVIKIKKDGELTPEYIQGKLFSFANAAHKFHLDTISFAEHKALNNFYEALDKYKDSILEELMGYLGGRRIGKLKMDEVPEYSKNASVELAEEVVEFAYQLYEWAGKKDYCNVENQAQELSGIASKTIYLLTLT